MKKTILLISIIFSALLTMVANANTLTGVITDAEGNPMNGVMVRVTDAQSIVSEVVYSNPQGEYKLATILEGDLSIRTRLPYFKDQMASVSLTGTANLDLVMEPMTDLAEISDSLPAAYHFGSLPFEEGDDANEQSKRVESPRGSVVLKCPIGWIHRKL